MAIVTEFIKMEGRLRYSLVDFLVLFVERLTGLRIDRVFTLRLKIESAVAKARKRRL
jgi:hypothetical protein